MKDVTVGSQENEVYAVTLLICIPSSIPKQNFSVFDRSGFKDAEFLRVFLKMDSNCLY